MSNSSNWPIAVTGYDSLRLITKRVDRSSRNASPISAVDLLGPGMSSQAVHILDWNDEVATFNGFFYTTTGGLNSPVVQDEDGDDVTNLPWIGTAIAREDGTGTHQVWNTDDPSSMYFRVRNWAPNTLDPDGPVIYGDWQRFATRSGFIAEEDLDPDVRDRIDQALEDAEAALGLVVPANYVFRQDTEPTATPDRDLLNYDIWFDTDADDLMRVWFDGAWVLPDEEILSGAGAAAVAALVAAQAAANDAAAAIIAADGKNTTYRQDAEPTGGTYVVGDTWEDTNDLNKPYRWNGTAWVLAITGWLQTDGTTARGIKITSTGLVAYDGAGSPTFTIVGATGSVVMTGDLAVGSTITGATITGTLQTTTTANRGVKITSGGMVFYDTGGSPVLSFSSSTGILSVTGPIVSGANISGSSVTASSGGVIQSESTANRGVKINSAGLVAYDGSGSPTFILTGSTGAITMLGSLTSGSSLTVTGSGSTASLTTLGGTASRGALDLSASGIFGSLYATSGALYMYSDHILEITAATLHLFGSSITQSATNFLGGVSIASGGLSATGGVEVLTGALDLNGNNINAVNGITINGSIGTLSTFIGMPEIHPTDLYVTSMPSFAPSTHLPVYRNTSTGRLFMSTSSARYKTDIQDADLDFVEIIRAVRAVTYRSRPGFTDPSQEHKVLIGGIAEEFAAEPLLERFVAYDEDGLPQGIDLTAMIVPIIGAFQILEDRVAALEPA